jgi:hypothetical protein
VLRLHMPQWPECPRYRGEDTSAWDFKHGQMGVAPNAIELQPILAGASEETRNVVSAGPSMKPTPGLEPGTPSLRGRPQAAPDGFKRLSKRRSGFPIGRASLCT